MATQTLPLREIEATEIKTVSILLKLDQSESGPDPTHSLLSIVDSTREILTGFNDPRMESHSRKAIAFPASEPIYGSTETLKLMEAADLEAPADQDDPPAMP